MSTLYAEKETANNNNKNNNNSDYAAVIEKCSCKK
jgi:hypothetical protein